MLYLAVLLVVGIVCRVESSSHHFQEIGGKYYYIAHYAYLDWFGARDECRKMNAHLVSIKNYQEWHSISSHLKKYKSYWVDIRDVNSNLKWISDTSGWRAPFLKWSHGQPRLKAYYDCVKLRAGSHKMKTKYCAQQNHYICEANSRPATVIRPPIPTSPPTSPPASTPNVHYPSTGYEIIEMRYH